MPLAFGPCLFITASNWFCLIVNLLALKVGESWADLSALINLEIKNSDNSGPYLYLSVVTNGATGLTSFLQQILIEYS